jgi:hypothetical protein
MKAFLKSLFKALILEPPPASPEATSRPAAVTPSTVPQSAIPQSAIPQTIVPQPADPRRATDSPLDPRYSPASLLASQGTPEAPRPKLFDPALKQFGHAFRHGEPVFQDLALGDAWRRSRRRVVDHLVKALAVPEVCDRLVLRGSLLLKLWLGEHARTPGDIDWVVLPPGCTVQGHEAKVFFDRIVAAIRAADTPAGIRLFTNGNIVDDIWTYERAPGKRVIVGWQADNLPPGTVQIDFVFGEPLPDNPEPIEYFTADGELVKLLAAGREASLIWKLVWLATDIYPQGKDLYDAVLLARTVVPRLDKLDAALLAQDNRADPWTPETPHEWAIDWENFLADYPHVAGTWREYRDELVDLLRPMFDPAPPAGGATT